MAHKPNHGFERRKREQARKERAAARRERRKARGEARKGGGGADQDLDGIVAGIPAPNKASDAEVLAAIERAMNPGKAAREASRTRHPARAAAARLFVGNLDFSVDEKAIRELFKEAGFAVADVSVVRDRDTGESRGFAFVELAKPEDSSQAIQVLDGEEFGGRRLRVNQAEQRSGR